MNANQIGSTISALRREKGVTQEELAKNCGISAQAVSKWEKGSVPDVELLPVIADYFGVSIDSLFGRKFGDYPGLYAAAANAMTENREDSFAKAYDFCYTMTQALFRSVAGKRSERKFQSIAEYKEECKDDPKNRVYSEVNEGREYLQMGLLNTVPYFLLVCNEKDSDINELLLNGIDYPAFFKDMSDPDFFNALILLYKRPVDKSFTPNLLVNNLNINEEKAQSIIDIMEKYHMLRSKHVELDDAIMKIYEFNPISSFVSMLIFAREIIDPREYFHYRSRGGFPVLFEANE